MAKGEKGEKSERGDKAAKPAGKPSAAATAAGLTEVRQREMRGEFAGLVLLTAGLAFAASLVSHDPRDMAAVAAGKGFEQIANWLGPVGARMADLLLHFFGLGAFLINALVLLLALATLTGRMRAPRFGMAAGALAASLSSLILLHLVAQKLAWRPLGKEAAGLIPGAIAMVLKAMLKTTGTALVATATLLAAIAVMSGKSLTSMMVRWAARRAAPVVEQAAGATADAAQKGWQQFGATVRNTVGAGKKKPTAQDEALADAWLDSAEAQQEYVLDLGAPPVPPQADAQPQPQAEPAATAKPAGTTQREFAVSAADLLASGAIEPLWEATAVAKPAPGSRQAIDVVDLPAAAPATAPAIRVPAADDGRETAPYNPVGEPRKNPGPTLRMNAVEVGQALSELQDAAAGELPEIGAAFVMPVVDDRAEAQEAAAIPPPPSQALAPRSFAAAAAETQGDDVRIVETEALKNTPAAQVLEAVQQSLQIDGKAWVLPPSTLLAEPPRQALHIDDEAMAILRENAATLKQKLADFGIVGEVGEIRPGPVVTTYEFKPAPGIKISKIVNLKDDLTMSLSSLGVRVVAPIPNRDVVGIEVANKDRQTVYFRDVLERQEFRDNKGLLPLILGKDIEGKPMMLDLAKAPHLLVAGSTGTGKSVGINSFIASLLFRCSPDEVKLILVDPKIVELKMYSDIPHLLLPVLDEVRKAELALKWACKEMDRRFQILADAEVRNLAGYKAKLPELRQAALRKAMLSGQGTDAVEMPEDMPYIVVVIDEFADLIMQAGKEVEVPVARLGQKARAAGIHVILATQRPSTDVITGLIKANFPTRLSFKVAQGIDSRVILGVVGAETLLGNGDMLVVPPGEGVLRRCHGTWINETEVGALVQHWKDQGAPKFEMDILHDPEAEAEAEADDGALDELYEDAVTVVLEAGQASVSFLQRKLGIGYGRAAKLIDKMERKGIVGPSRGPNKPREIRGRA